jgi:hypothetical protein
MPPFDYAIGFERAKAFWQQRRPYRISDHMQGTGYRRARRAEVVHFLRKAADDKDSPLEEYNMCEGICMDSEMEEFGLGVFLYFDTLWRLALLLASCSFIYSSTIFSYSKINSEAISEIDYTLQGCAITTRLRNVLTNITSYDGVQRESLTWAIAAPDMAVCVVLLCYSLFSLSTEHLRVQNANQSIQTASDYSIEITNPPPTADNPDAYRKFFERFGLVINVAVSKQNALLVSALAQRKAIERETQLHGSVIGGDGNDGSRKSRWDAVDGVNPTSSQSPSVYTGLLQMLGLRRDLGYWRQQAQHNEQLVKEQLKAAGWREEQEQQQGWDKVGEGSELMLPVNRVYVTFNTERAQRRCLHAMSEGLLWTAAPRTMRSCWSFFRHCCCTQVRGMGDEALATPSVSGGASGDGNVSFDHLMRPASATGEGLVHSPVAHSAGGASADASAGEGGGCSSNLFLRHNGVAHRLRVVQPAEPSEIIWQNLDVTMGAYLLQLGLSAGLCVGLLSLSFYATRPVMSSDATDASVKLGIFVAILNATVPTLLVYTSLYERHGKVEDVQSSMMLKLVAFRFCNTALLIFAATSADQMVSSVVGGVDAAHLSRTELALANDELYTPSIFLVMIHHILNN